MATTTKEEFQAAYSAWNAAVYDNAPADVQKRLYDEYLRLSNLPKVASVGVKSEPLPAAPAPPKPASGPAPLPVVKAEPSGAPGPMSWLSSWFSREPSTTLTAANANELAERYRKALREVFIWRTLVGVGSERAADQLSASSTLEAQFKSFLDTRGPTALKDGPNPALDAETLLADYVRGKRGSALAGAGSASSATPAPAVAAVATPTAPPRAESVTPPTAPPASSTAETLESTTKDAKLVLEFDNKIPLIRRLKNQPLTIASSVLQPFNPTVDKEKTTATVTIDLTDSDGRPSTSGTSLFDFLQHIVNEYFFRMRRVATEVENANKDESEKSSKLVQAYLESDVPDALCDVLVPVLACLVAAVRELQNSIAKTKMLGFLRDATAYIFIRCLTGREAVNNAPEDKNTERPAPAADWLGSNASDAFALVAAPLLPPALAALAAKGRISKPNVRRLVRGKPVALWPTETTWSEIALMLPVLSSLDMTAGDGLLAAIMGKNDYQETLFEYNVSVSATPATQLAEFYKKITTEGKTKVEWLLGTNVAIAHAIARDYLAFSKKATPYQLLGPLPALNTLITFTAESVAIAIIDRLGVRPEYLDLKPKRIIKSAEHAADHADTVHADALFDLLRNKLSTAIKTSKFAPSTSAFIKAADQKGLDGQSLFDVIDAAPKGTQYTVIVPQNEAWQEMRKLNPVDLAHVLKRHVLVTTGAALDLSKLTGQRLGYTTLLHEDNPSDPDALLLLAGVDLGNKQRGLTIYYPLRNATETASIISEPARGKTGRFVVIDRAIYLDALDRTPQTGGYQAMPVARPASSSYTADTVPRPPLPVGQLPAPLAPTPTPLPPPPPVGPTSESPTQYVPIPNAPLAAGAVVTKSNASPVERLAQLQREALDFVRRAGIAEQLKPLAAAGDAVVLLPPAADVAALFASGLPAEAIRERALYHVVSSPDLRAALDACLTTRKSFTLKTASGQPLKFSCSETSGRKAGRLYAGDISAEQTGTVQPAGLAQTVRVFRIPRALAPRAAKAGNAQREAMALLGATDTLEKFRDAVADAEMALLLPPSRDVLELLKTEPAPAVAASVVLGHAVARRGLDAALAECRKTRAAVRLTMASGGALEIACETAPTDPARGVDSRVLTADLALAAQPAGFVQPFTIWRVPRVLMLDTPTAAPRAKWPWQKAAAAEPAAAESAGAEMTEPASAKLQKPAETRTVETFVAEHAAAAKALAEAPSFAAANAAVQTLAAAYAAGGGAAAVRQASSADAWKAATRTHVEALNSNLLLSSTDKGAVRAALTKLGAPEAPASK